MHLFSSFTRVLIAFLIGSTALSLGFVSYAWGQTENAGKRDAPSSPRISYQGRLTDGTGNPVADGNHTIVFKLYHQASGGSALWEETQDLETSNGVFSAELGAVNDLSGVSFDQTLFLGIAVDGGSELTPRTRLTGAPYAQQARAIGDSTVTASTVKAGAVTLEKLGQSGATKGEVIRWDGSEWTPDTLEASGGSDSASSWGMSGNSGTNPPSDFLGTTDGQPLVIKVNGERALRIAPDDTAASITAGHPANSIADLSGAVIGGGGSSDKPNEITGSFATIGGGLDNTASGEWATVGGGRGNTASENDATVGGGVGNTASSSSATVGGGQLNTASEYETTVGGGRKNTASKIHATVGGGNENTASGRKSTVGGGDQNTASSYSATVGGGSDNTAKGQMSAVGGGADNLASGEEATVPGGGGNRASGFHSFAAGEGAKANHDGSFVWGDSRDDSVYSSAQDQFIVGATGGIGLVNVNDPDAPVHIGSQNNWDLANSEGDLKVGTDNYRLKIGVSTGGGGAGDVRIGAHGGSNHLIFNSDATDVAVVDASEGLYPSGDDSYTLGTSSNRWSAVYASNGTIQTSDRRLKTGIDSLDYGLAELLRLEPVTYRWKHETGTEGHTADQHLGLIAQQVEDVLGEVVQRPQTRDGYLGMNYSELIPVLVRGIQEQQAQIETQSGTIARQRATIERQQAHIDSLKAQVKAQHRQQQAQISALKKQVQKLADQVQEAEGSSAQPVSTTAAE